MSTEIECPDPVISTPTSTTIFRTFRLCDHKGHLIATVRVKAEVEIDPEQGITEEEALNRLNRGFRLTFAPISRGKEAESMFQSDGEDWREGQKQRPKRVLTEEHKRKMQEGRQGERRGEKSSDEIQKQQAMIESNAATIYTALKRLSLTRPNWSWSKSEVQTEMEGSMSDSDWNVALKWLLQSGQIEKQGEKRGSRYRKV